jgi:hypothetical protein
VEVSTREVGDENGITYRYLVQMWPRGEDTPLEVRTFDEVAEAEDQGECRQRTRVSAGIVSWGRRCEGGGCEHPS